MLCLPVKARWFLIVAVMALALPHTALLAGQEGRAGKEAADKPGPAEAIRKALDQAVTLMTKHRALEDTVQRARHYGAIATDALALFPASSMKEALEETVEFCICRSS